uniref:Uncharacterized protein n=1 Tax=Globisporangium ultimum (strain ATCC 200006 / CBS 805.95 / DAOM BR144) TaxID=431595 RepID=K3W6V6_GLOUD
MAVQVAQAAEPQTPTTFSDSVLSPVSKLEVARKHAAAEQQRRIDEACARMVEVKKENANKRKALEEKLESHKKTKGDGTIVKRLADNFDDGDEEENVKVVQQTKVVEQQQTTVTTENTSYDATQELLRATRSKLNELVDATEKSVEANETVKTEEGANNGDWKGPSTNYHLKQLGLTAKKIDIYAPVEVQQQELRRLRDRSRYGQTLKLTDPIDDHDSENDSDFVPEEATDENDADEDSDAESIPEVDADETQQLVQEAAEHEQKLRRRAQLLRIPVYIILFCIVAIASLAAVEFTQRHYTICPLDAQSVETDDRTMSCASFLHVRATATAFVQDSVAAATAFSQETAASIRSRFEEL